MSDLAIELIAIIIDHLAGDDDEHFTSLKTCSLVNRDTLYLCRKHIFASITLNDIYVNNPSPTTRMFERLLSRNAEIAQHIRALNYCILEGDCRVLELPRLLHKISKLQSLEVWSYSMRGKFNWRRPYFPIRDALLHLLHQPTLISLKLMFVRDFPLADLAPCVNLKTLFTHGLEITEEGADFPSTIFPSRQIELVEFSAKKSAEKVIRALLRGKRPDGASVVNLSGLKKVSLLWMNSQAVEASADLLKELSSLVDADIFLFADDLTWKGLGPMLLPSIKTLKRLDLSMTTRGSDDPLSGICAELTEMSGKNVIEILSIHVHVDTDCNCRRGSEWGLLDKTIIEPKAFPSLTELSLEIVTARYGRQDYELEDALNELPDTQLKGVASAESFNFKFRLAQIHYPSSRPFIIAIIHDLLYVAFFAISWGPVGWVVTSENIPLSVSAKGMSLQLAVELRYLLRHTLVNPTTYAINGEKAANLSVKVFVIWGGTCVGCIIFTYFFIPETRGLSLKQIDRLYPESSIAEIIQCENAKQTASNGLHSTGAI